MIGIANDFQQQGTVFIDKPYKKVIASNHNFQVTANNLIQSAIYYTVRRCIPHTWLNHNDQFLFPNEGWEKDTGFQNDCLAYILFNNNIKSQDGTNYWIPYTADEVGAGTNFESNFMTKYMRGKANIENGDSYLFSEMERRPKVLKFSPEAKDVLNAGKKLWQYYHKQSSANVNASFYDIKEFFQGRDEKTGNMNIKSNDEHYIYLIGELRSSLKKLSENIQPKIYEYGFLLK